MSMFNFVNSNLLKHFFIIFYSIFFLFFFSQTKNKCNIDFDDRQTPDFMITNRIQYAAVTILPEIELCHPIYGFDSNSLSKFRRNEKLKMKLQQFHCQSLRWPNFVYKMYDVSIACDKIKKFLATLKIGKNLILCFFLPLFPFFLSLVRSISINFCTHFLCLFFFASCLRYCSNGLGCNVILVLSKCYLKHGMSSQSVPHK